MTNSNSRADMFIHLAGRLRLPITQDTKVLDLGCGSGNLVSGLLKSGVDAAGCDINFKSGAETQALITNGLLRKIELDPYSLPFEDSSVDLLISDQVLEHVENLPETCDEIRRVLRPGGITIHIFPSKYTPIEPHVRVPMATIVQNRTWLALWHAMGVGSRAGNIDAGDIVENNCRYLSSSTHYRSHSELDSILQRYFDESGDLEREFLDHRLKDRKLLRIIATTIPIPLVYKNFRDRVVFARKH